MKSLARRSLPIPILALALACSSSPADPGDRPPAGPPAGAVTVDGIEYSATVQVMESFPVQIAATVTVANHTDETRTVAFADGCVALLRAYDGETQIWDQAEEVACTMATVPVELSPGESEEFRTPTSSGYDILDDEWPDGTYRMAIYLRPIGEEVEIDAGLVDLAIPR